MAGSKPSGFNWYVAGNLFKEDGWRDDSPSDVRQVFGKVGWQRSTSEFFVSVGHANNSLNGNALQEVGFLDREYGSVYTKPDTTENRSTFLNVTGRRSLNARISVSGNVYYRDIHTDTFNGDINEDSLDQAVYQPNAAEQAALARPDTRDFRRAAKTRRTRHSRHGAASRMASFRTSPPKSATARSIEARRHNTTAVASGN